MAEVLASEHQVRLVTTGTCSRSHPAMAVGSASGEDMEELARWADVLVLQGGVLHANPALALSDKVIVVDVYDPFHLENLEQGRGSPLPDREAVVDHLTGVLNHELRRGDFFLCANGRQRDFWTGSMTSLGRVNPSTYDEDETLSSLLAIVPSGVPADPPKAGRAALRGVVEGIGAGDKVILWAGGVYNWLDPLTLVRSVDRLRHRVPDVRLFFLGMQHPNPHIPPMRVASELRRLAADLDLVGSHVFFNDGWVDYDARAGFLLEADVGVSTHLEHIETAYSSRTRILDYLWSGLPVVATSGDSWSELVEREGVGCTVPPGDVGALEDALALILTDRDKAAECRAAAARVVPDFHWERVLAPLVEFCRAPRRAPDLVRERANPPAPVAAGTYRSRLVDAYRDGGPPLVLRRVAGAVARRAGGSGSGRLASGPDDRQSH